MKLLISAIVMLVVIGCDDSSTEPEREFDIVTALDTVIINVRANGFSYFQNTISMFISDTIDVEVVVTSYEDGEGFFELTKGTDVLELSP